MSAPASKTNVTCPRPTWRCPSCRLNQFVSDRCRRCRRAYQTEEEKAAEREARAVAVIERRMRLATRGMEAAAEPSQPLPYLARRARELRLFRKLSQQAVGARLNVPRTYISKLETGGVGPGWKTILGLAWVLKVPLEALVEEDDVVGWCAVAARGMTEGERGELVRWCAGRAQEPAAGAGSEATK